MKKARAVLLLVLLALLAGCGGAALEPRSFDLGLAAPSARLPALRLGAVQSLAPFDATEMQYRLAFRNSAEIAAYAGSRWAATPAEMLRKQLTRAAGEAPGKCVLDLEVQEFSQVFSAKETSEARVELRAALRGVAARSFSIAEPGAGSDAASGAAAFARAANRAVDELGAWVTAQPGCR